MTGPSSGSNKVAAAETKLSALSDPSLNGSGLGVDRSKSNSLRQIRVTQLATEIESNLLTNGPIETTAGYSPSKVD